MRGPTFFVALVGIASALVTAPAHAIIGGADAPNDSAVVAVRMPFFGAYCSGALVAPRLVLTAGHCRDQATTIVIGSDESNGESVKISSKASHPQYTAEGADFDLAVLVLEHDVTSVTPLAINHQALDSTLVGKVVRHVGFGTTEEGNILRIGHKHTVSYPVTAIDSTKVYSGTKTANTCDGDSGSPTLFTGDDGIERIIAVVSDGADCHSAGWDIRLDHPDVVAWLDPLIAQYGGPPPEDSKDAGPPKPDAAASPVPLANDDDDDDEPVSETTPPAAEPAADETSPAASSCSAARGVGGGGALAFALALAGCLRRRRAQGSPAR